MCRCVNVWMCECVRVRVCVCVCVFMFTFVCIYLSEHVRARVLVCECVCLSGIATLDHGLMALGVTGYVGMGLTLSFTALLLTRFIAPEAVSRVST